MPHESEIREFVERSYMRNNLKEVRSEITRINKLHGETLFNPAATQALEEVMAFLQSK